MKSRVLFVDDDPNVLSGLRRMLRPMRKEWHMAFAASGAEALDLMQRELFDVVVSDMRMPVMDGPAFLTHVRDQHPGVVRIVLSGHAEQTTSLRSAQVAHQFLSKPCSTDVLRATIARAAELQPRLADVGLRCVLGGIETLPSPSRTLVDLNAVFARRDPNLDEVGEILERDVATSAKLLQLVNSAFFGLGHRITSVDHAIRYLGLETVRTLAVALSAFRTFEGQDALNQKWLAQFHNHSFGIAEAARGLALNCGLKDQATEIFGAALLHDIGSLVLAATMPDEQREIERRISGGETKLDAERRLLGATHCDVGAYLLALWGLPRELVATAAHHHAPTEGRSGELSAAEAVYIGEAVERRTLDVKSYLAHRGLEAALEDPGVHGGDQR